MLEYDIKQFMACAHYKAANYRCQPGPGSVSSLSQCWGLSSSVLVYFRQITVLLLLLVITALSSNTVPTIITEIKTPRTLGCSACISHPCQLHNLIIGHCIHIQYTPKSLENKRGYFDRESDKWVLICFRKVISKSGQSGLNTHSLWSLIAKWWDGTGIDIDIDGPGNTSCRRDNREMWTLQWSGQRQRPTNISELNTDSALVAVSSVPDQIGILAVTIKIISNFKCANKNIYCLQWPSGYWALGPLWLHNLNTKAI